MRLIGPEVIMIKRILFILMVCCALGFGYSKGLRPAVELNHSVQLWGYELRFELLLEALRTEAAVGDTGLAARPGSDAVITISSGVV